MDKCLRKKRKIRGEPFEDERRIKVEDVNGLKIGGKSIDTREKWSRQKDLS